MEMADLYLLNTLIIPIRDDQAKFDIRRVSVDEAKNIIKGAEKITSAIGHQATANVLSMLLQMKVETNRISIYFQPGDEAIALVLKKRLPEGTVIQSEKELEEIGYDLFYIKRTE